MSADQSGPAEYPALGHYQDPAVAADYDRRRFTGLAGRWKLHVAWIRWQQALAYWPAPLRVLDVACGTARFREAIERAGYRWIGVDVSRPMLERARARGTVPGPVARGRVERLPCGPRSVDVVMCARFVHHLGAGPRQQALRELARVARRGVVVEVVIRRWWRDAGRTLTRWLVGRRARRAYPSVAEAEREIRAAGLALLAQVPLNRWFSNAVLLVCACPTASRPASWI